MYRLCNLRTSAPSAFPRFWLDEQWQRRVSLAHKEFRKRKKKMLRKILNSYSLSNQNSYIQYFSVPSLPCLRSYLVLHVQLNHVVTVDHLIGQFWPRLRVGSSTGITYPKKFSAGDRTLNRFSYQGYFAVSSQCYLQKLLF